MSYEADPSVRALADRHYSRQTPGSTRFVQAGRALVLKVPGGRLEWVPLIRDGRVERLAQIEVAQAGWVTHWPIAEYVRHEWAGAWVNQFFHNESDHHASDLIREAVAITAQKWVPPTLGMVTMIDPGLVASGKREDGVVGYCYRRAGFRHVGWTKTEPRKMVFQLSREKILRLAERARDFSFETPFTSAPEGYEIEEHPRLFDVQA